MIHITVNGVPAAIDEATTVKEYLETHHYSLGRIAIELNGSILPKSSYAATPLSEADTMEIVTFVGGG